MNERVLFASALIASLGFGIGSSYFSKKESQQLRVEKETCETIIASIGNAKTGTQKNLEAMDYYFVKYVTKEFFVVRDHPDLAFQGVMPTQVYDLAYAMVGAEEGPSWREKYDGKPILIEDEEYYLDVLEKVSLKIRMIDADYDGTITADEFRKMRDEWKDRLSPDQLE